MTIYQNTFELSIISNLIFHKEYREIALPHIKEHYWRAGDETPLKVVFKLIKKYVDDYHKPPTPDILAIEFNNDSTDLSHEYVEQTRDLIAALSEKNNKPLDWIVASSEDWCRGRAYYHATLDSLHAKNQRDRLDALESMQAASLVSFHNDTTALGEWDAGTDTTVPPPRGWLLGNIFARKFMSSLIGDGGVGKTAVRYGELLSLATGQSLTNEYVFCRCRVLIISLEDDADELRRRIMAVIKHHNIDRKELKGWLFLAAPGGKAGKLMTMDGKRQLSRGELAEHLERTIVKHAIDIVSIDPFVKSHSVDENNNSAIDDVVQILTDLAIKHNIAIDAPHHTSKGLTNPGNADKGRGASAMKDAARLVYTLSPMNEKEAEQFGVDEDERLSLVRMDSAKVNITRPTYGGKWYRLVGVKIGNADTRYQNGDEVQTVEPWSPPDIWEGMYPTLQDRILSEIDGGLGDGVFYSDSTRDDVDRAAWKLVQHHLTDKPDGQCKEIIKRWKENGLLELFEYEDARRKTVKGLRKAVAPSPLPDGALMAQKRGNGRAPSSGFAIGK
jgi:hypothetical protein